MRILFVHNGAQPRFRQLAARFARDPANEVVLAGRRAKAAPPGVRTAQFNTTRPGGEHCHRYLRDVERAVLVGQGVTRLGADLHLAGFRPDVVYGEGGSGVCLYLREAFAAARLVVAFGAYLRPGPWPDADAATDAATATTDTAEGSGAPPRRPPAEADAACLLRARNGATLVDLAQCDHGVVASRWALDRFPPLADPVLSLLVDGVDERFFAPTDHDATGGAPDRGREVVTVACSRLAGADGVDAVAAVLVELQRRPRCHVVVVGGDLRKGGPQPAVGTWAARGVDVTRLRVIGPLAPASRRDLLQATSAYVHLGPADETAGPLEAMSCGCLVVVPDGGPTAELVQHGRSGLTFPVAELATGPAALGALVATAMGDGGLVALLGKAAREAVLQHHRLQAALDRHARLVEDVAAGRRGADVEGSVVGHYHRTVGVATARGAR